MRIGMLAASAVTVVAVAGCSAPAADAPATPSSATPTVTASSVPTVDAASAAAALAAVTEDQGVMGPDSGDAARFVTSWWDSLDPVTQAAACQQWNGVNMDRVIREYVPAEWSDPVWDTTGVRLELSATMDQACIG